MTIVIDSYDIEAELLIPIQSLLEGLSWPDKHLIPDLKQLNHLLVQLLQEKDWIGIAVHIQEGVASRGIHETITFHSRFNFEVKQLLFIHRYLMIQILQKHLLYVDFHILEIANPRITNFLSDIAEELSYLQDNLK